MINLILKGLATDNCGSLDHSIPRRNIVHSYFLALWGPKPGLRAANVKPKNHILLSF